MFGLFKKSGTVVYGVLYDIGSESVGVSIVASNRLHETPTVLFSHRVDMRITKRIGTNDEQMRHMREALFSASLIISRDGLAALTAFDKHAKITEIFVTVSAPWSHTLARNVKYEGETDLKVTRPLIDDLVGSAEMEINSHIQETDLMQDITYSVVERATIDVRINDYNVKNPVGLHGKEISLVHVTGLVPDDVIEAVKEVQEKIFPNTTLRTHTFLLVLHCVLREVMEGNNELTMIDITGETTEFGIIEGGTLVETISIPYGLNSVIRSMMTKENETAKEMRAQLDLYQRGDLSPEFANDVKKHLEEYGEVIRTSLDTHTTTRRFPKNAFVIAPNGFTDLFKKTLAPVVHDELGITTEIVTLPQDVLNMTAPNDATDLNVSVTSRFFHKLHGCGEIETP